MKSQGIAEVHPLVNMSDCTEFHGNPSSSCGDISDISDIGGLNDRLAGRLLLYMYICLCSIYTLFRAATM